MRRIKFVDLGRLHDPIKSELNEVVRKIVEKNNYILGEELVEFEDRWAKYTGQKYAVGVSSGYHALELSKIAIFIDGAMHVDEIYSKCSVAFPVNSYIATANAFSDMLIQFFDIHPHNHLIDLKIEKMIEYISTDEDFIFPEIIVPVHLYGQPCNMDEIEKLVSKVSNRDISCTTKIIEDACQAHGVDNKLIGRGLTTCYSFYPSKNLGCFGDGGVVTTNDKEMEERIRLLRSHGEIRKNEHNIVGFNCRLDTLQAAILDVKLDYLDEWNNKRREIAKQYHEELDGTQEYVKLLPYNEDSVYHLFVVECEYGSRNSLKQYLSEHGIECGIHYPTPIHKQVAYFLEYKDIKLPVAEDKAKRVLSLPMYPGLEVDEVSYVCNAIKNFD